MATLQGVYSAIVVDNREPHGLGRVKVRLAAGGESPAGGEVWARVATMMAGKNRGSWFIPEADDEVLVAFERGDLRMPFVIGALWNDHARPPESVDETNTLKLIRSRNGVTFRIRDDAGKESLTLETPAG